MTMRGFARAICVAAALAVAASAFGVEFERIEQLEPLKRIEAYTTLLGQERDSVEILFKLGNAYYDAEMTDEAIGAYRRSLAAGGDFKVFVNLTFVLAEAGKRDEADAAFQERIRLTPNDAVLYAYYGDFLAEDPDKTKPVPKAMDAYRKALGLDAKCVEAHYGLGNLFVDAGIYEEAVVEWGLVLTIDPKHRLAAEARANIDRVNREFKR
jgi:tetratricopeptide (TPR) repeat protein